MATQANPANPANTSESESRHVCTPVTCPDDGGYYVSCKDGRQWWLMAGPYSTHAAALADVERALKIANDRDGRAWFMSWGTCHMKDTYREPGVLNKHKLI